MKKSQINFVLTCIVLLAGLLAAGKLYADSQDSISEGFLPTSINQSQIAPSPILPNNTEIVDLDPSGTQSSRSRLRINLEAYPQVLDPQKAILPKEIAFLNLMYQGLTRLDESLAAAPAAAESWFYNQDATELTFILRRGLVYSDNSPLNAMRFAAALQRLIDPATRSEFSWLADPIRGAVEWHQVDPDTSGYTREHYVSQLGIQAMDEAGLPCTSTDQVDCLILKLEFSRPAPYFHNVMGLWITYPARLDFIREGETNWWLRAENRSGNGAFILVDLEPFVKARFVPNPAYQGNQAGVTIEFYFISGSQAALQSYRNNRLEIIEEPALEMSAGESTQVTQTFSNQSVVVPGACSSMILFGISPIGEGQPSPFSDPKVRQAFVLAFDSQAWLRDVDHGKSIFTGTFIPPGLPASKNISQPYNFDPLNARQALVDSSYGGPQAFNELGLKLAYEDTPENQARYTWLANNYRKYLGVEMALDPQPAEHFTALKDQPGFTSLLAFQSWCGLYPDPQSWLADYWDATSPFRPNTGYANRDLQVLLQEAETKASAVERLEIFTQAHQLLLDDAPAIFGLVSLNRYLVKPWVKGMVTSPFDSVWPGALFPEKITIEP